MPLAQRSVFARLRQADTGDTRIDVRGNTGFFVPKSYPKYLGSAEYMTLYNEARVKAFLLLKSAIFAFPHERHLKPTTATTT